MSAHAGAQRQRDKNRRPAGRDPRAAEHPHCDRCPFPRWLPDDRPLPASVADVLKRPRFTAHERAVIAAAIEHLARHHWPLKHAAEFIACTLGLPPRVVKNLRDTARFGKLKSASLEPYSIFLEEAAADDGYAAFDRIEALLASLHLRSVCR
jgi:hypothetical protein